MKDFWIREESIKRVLDTGHSHVLYYGAMKRRLADEEIHASWAPKEVEDRILELCRKLDLVHSQRYFPILAGLRSSAQRRIASHIGRIFQHFKEGTGGIVSAFIGKGVFEEGDPRRNDPGLVLAKNIKRNDQLAQEISSLGYGYIRTMGMWTNPETGKREFERSFFIPNIPEEEIRRLAQEWGQFSYLTYDHGRWEERLSSSGAVRSSGTGFHVIIGDPPGSGASRTLNEENRWWQFLEDSYSRNSRRGSRAYGLLAALESLWEEAVGSD